MRPEWVDKIREEVKKQIEVGFLEVVRYPKWLANIVPVPKKNGKVRMCVDYRDLNKACCRHCIFAPSPMMSLGRKKLEI